MNAFLAGVATKPTAAVPTVMCVALIVCGIALAYLFLRPGGPK